MWRQRWRRLGEVLVIPALAGVLTLGSSALEARGPVHRTDPVGQLVTAVAAIPPAPTTSTTTTMRPPPPRTVRTRADRSAIRYAGAINGYPCGGDLPPCWVLNRESRGNPTAVNPRGCSAHITGGCGGLWQFDPRTWVGCWCPSWRSMTYRGYARAEHAPAEVQNARAREVWRGGAGCGNWDAC